MKSDNWVDFQKLIKTSKEFTNAMTIHNIKAKNLNSIELVAEEHKINQENVNKALVKSEIYTEEEKSIDLLE